MDFARTPVVAARRPTRQTNAEGSVWRRYQHPLTFRHKSAPTSIDFSPIAPHDFCVASSLQVDIFSSQSNAIYRTLTRFKDVACCATYRHDGKMLAAGDEQGCTQLFDLSSRSVMRSFRGHERAVKVVRFSGDGSRLFTGSDDKTLICWEVAAEAELRKFEGHGDFVRCARVNHAINGRAGAMVLSGSYDHTVKVWDVKSPNAIMSLSHGEPVEDMALLNGGGLVAVAHGPCISIWDLLSGGRLLQTVRAHSKTIMGLHVDEHGPNEGSHLLSCSLDHFVKVYELSQYTVVGSIKYSAPLLSLSLSPQRSHLCVGMSDNTLCVRRLRPKGISIDAANELEQGDLKNRGRPGQMADSKPGISARYDGHHPGTYRFFLRGRTHAPQDDDVVVRERGNPHKLNRFDKALKSFNYHAALDAAVQNGAPEVVVSVVEELVRRNGLRAALSGRDQATLQPILSFLIHQITLPPFAGVLISVANLLLDMYAPVLGQSAAIDESFVKLRGTLEAELQLHTELAQLMGAMDVLFAGALPSDAVPSKLQRLGSHGSQAENPASSAMLPRADATANTNGV